MSIDVPAAPIAHRVDLIERAEAAFPQYRVEITESGDIHLATSPSRRHARIGVRLAQWLRDRVGDPLRVYETGHILTQGFGMREPDVMVFDGRELPDDWATPAEYLRLVVEINSPSNSDNDWRVKIVEYAVSGIPYYWIVDTDERLTMFTLRTGADGRPTYVAEPEARPTVDELIAMPDLPGGIRL